MKASSQRLWKQIDPDGATPIPPGVPIKATKEVVGSTQVNYPKRNRRARELQKRSGNYMKSWKAMLLGGTRKSTTREPNLPSDKVEKPRSIFLLSCAGCWKNMRQAGTRRSITRKPGPF